ncbi:MAG: helix-turn-helix transcriptional regulator [Actinomycetia bacterium]|nr:helix-turn-helix transcriptional regulator [Actinomycetes bacterium]
MHVRTVTDLGAAVRAERRRQGMTQAELAAKMHVGRDWVVRFESGRPRLEAQKVLDALAAVGLGLDVSPREADDDDLEEMFGEWVK